MRNIFLFTLLFLTCGAQIYAETATTIYEHQAGDPDVAITWSKTTEGTIAALALASAQVGDYVQVTVVGTGNMQLTLRNNNHVAVINTDHYTRNNVTEERVIRFGLTAAGLTEVQANDSYLAGANCNLKKIELISTNSEEDYSDVIFFGDRYCSYNGVQLRKANFSSAAAGMTLRVHHKDLASTHQMSLRTAWNTIITGYDYDDVTGDYTDYTIDDAILTAMTESDNILIYGKSLTITKVELFSPTKTVDVVATLYEGSTALVNWSRNYEQPLSIINSLQTGDVLKVIIGNKTDGSTNSQLRIAWGSTEGTYVSETGIHNKEFPYEFSLTLTADQVTGIQSAGKLYLNGCNIIVSKWTLTQHKTVSHDRGNAATTIWSGSQTINWSGNNEYQKVEASAFAEGQVGHRLRINFASMKLGAQGHIVDGNWKVFADANTFEKLPTAWGDYYEYTITQSMLDSLQERGLVVSGIGYTLKSVQLIDPLREYVVATTFDANDIRAWELSDGAPNLSVTFTNYETDSVHTSIDVSLMTDMFVDYNTYSQPVELAAGETKTVSIEFNDLVPGFYRMAAKANDNNVCTYYIGYDPTSIVSPDDSQDDFADFWNNWLSQLSAIPVAAELTLLEGQEGDARNIYEVKYKSVPETVGGEPVYIYGYYAEPKAEGKYPCIIHFHGTDKSGNLTKPSATETGWCEFRFSARGQTLDKAKNGSVKYRTDPEDESSVDFYAYRLGDNDEHYYRYVYLDTRRAVDFVRTREKVNTKNIFAAGGSQGGCLTYVCAALSNGLIRAIAPSITGHADFVHTMEIVGWPTNVFNTWINANYPSDYETGKSVLLTHQSYFDTKNFAKWITCPVITNFSLQDQTDGPHLNIAPYNLLTKVPAADKEYSINPFKGHATADDWSTTYMNFFNVHMDNTPDTPTAFDETNANANVNVGKFFRDGQLLIFRDGKEYSILGQIIK